MSKTENMSNGPGTHRWRQSPPLRVSLHEFLPGCESGRRYRGYISDGVRCRCREEELCVSEE